MPLPRSMSVSASAGSSGRLAAAAPRRRPHTTTPRAPSRDPRRRPRPSTPDAAPPTTTDRSATPARVLGRFYVGRDRLDDAVLLHRSGYLRRRGGNHRLRSVHVVDVSGDGDLVASIDRDVVRHIGARRTDGCRALRLAFQPALHVFDGVNENNPWHASSLS